MAKKTAEPTKLTEEQQASRETVLRMTAKRHVKIYLLKAVVGISPKEVAQAMGTNQGHVGNVLRDYAEHADKAERAQEQYKKATEKSE